MKELWWRSSRSVKFQKEYFKKGASFLARLGAAFRIELHPAAYRWRGSA